MDQDALRDRIDRLEQALTELESANNAVCAARPEDVYNAMLDAGMEDALIGLDKARSKARQILKEPSI